jgi:hypothetical protein
LEETERLVARVEKFEKLFNRGLSTCKGSIDSMLDVLASDKETEEQPEEVAEMFSL